MIKFDDSTLQRYVTEVKLLGDKDFVDVARESLNHVAMDAKKRTIPISAKKSFTVRNKTFFKAMTRVNYARRGQSATISGLSSEVGMFPNNKKGLTANYNSLENMEAQEHGGTVNRVITPLNKSRISASYNRAVSKTSMFSNSTMVVQSKMRGRNTAQRFRVALEVARKQNKKFVLGDEYNGVYAIQRTKIKRIFAYDESNKNKLKATHFMENASRESVDLLPAFFIKEAIKKIEWRASRIKY